MKLHPETPVTAIARFTLAGAPGKFQSGSAKWSSDNAKDIIGNQTDDAEAGTSRIDLDGNNNVEGDKTIISVTADADRGKGDVEIAASAEVIEWTPTVDIVADGVTIELTQAA